jgi:hypothetical protein
MLSSVTDFGKWAIGSREFPFPRVTIPKCPGCCLPPIGYRNKQWLKIAELIDGTKKSRPVRWVFGWEKLQGQKLLPGNTLNNVHKTLLEKAVSQREKRPDKIV